MIFSLKRVGIGLISLGVVLLAVQHFLHFTLVNALLISPLLLIIIGVVAYVWGMKRESPY